MESTELGKLVTMYLNQKGETVSPKKLQKLLYYIEAWHLVHLNKPLLEDEFEAWVHGPVIPSLYHHLKGFGWNNLEVLHDQESGEEFIKGIITKSELEEDQVSLIYSVLNKYGSLTSFQLEMLTHSERPWLDARGDLLPTQNCNNVISKEVMKEYYRSTLTE